jgi:hypothetical protein
MMDHEYALIIIYVFHKIKVKYIVYHIYTLQVWSHNIYTTQRQFIRLITWSHKTFPNCTIALLSYSIELVLKGVHTLQLVLTYIHTCQCCSCSSLNQYKDI